MENHFQPTPPSMYSLDKVLFLNLALGSCMAFSLFSPHSCLSFILCFSQAKLLVVLLVTNSTNVSWAPTICQVVEGIQQWTRQCLPSWFMLYQKKQAIIKHTNILHQPGANDVKINGAGWSIRLMGPGMSRKDLFEEVNMRRRVLQIEGVKSLRQQPVWYVRGSAGSQSGYRKMRKQEVASRRWGESRSFR